MFRRNAAWILVVVLAGLSVAGCGGRRARRATDSGTPPGDGSTGTDGGATCRTDPDCEHLSSACGTGRCDLTTGVCEVTPAGEDGTACDDGDACTSGDACAGGLCVGAAVDCGGLDGACERGACDPSTGACVATPIGPGEACDDGDPCTEGDACNAAGDCESGGPTDCSALTDACNVGMCDASDGCVAVPVGDGASCDDGDRCTTGDYCASGLCLGSPRDCSHLAGACAVGACNPSTGACEADPVADATLCDDGDACTTLDRCMSGVCTGGSPRDCSAFTDSCNVGMCDPPSGSCYGAPVSDGIACDDGDTCTVGDACSAGVCTGTNTCCRIEDIQINEVFGGTPDFIELVNTGTCSQDIGGLQLRFRLGCDTSTLTYTFTSRTLAPGAVFRLVDTSSTLSNEVYYGANICHNEYQAGWVALCNGACNTSTCGNFLDYFAQSGSGSSPSSPPTCASFTPSPLSMSSATSTQSANRVSFVGGGAAGLLSDWAMATHTR